MCQTPHGRCATHAAAAARDPCGEEFVLFPILDTNAWTLLEVEPMGTKPKVWLEDHDERRWLFKQVRADAQGTRGEDWAEKLAAEVGQRLGVAVARVELAERRFPSGSSRGIVSLSVLPGGVEAGWALEHGNELLSQQHPGYERHRRGEVPGYTPQAIAEVLARHRCEPPPGESSLGAPDVQVCFAGFLLLDAIIANSDRHHENWAVIRSPDERRLLAPSFDHASSLGFQEPEQTKARLLAEGRVDAWLERGRTKFEGGPSMVEVAVGWVAGLAERHRELWRDRIVTLTDDVLRSSIGAVPVERMSQVDRRFAFEIMTRNRSRLLDEL